ncbi:MAG: hypothetical protein ABIP17_03040 [Ilumatobacteraceae bacterium]
MSGHDAVRLRALVDEAVADLSGLRIDDPAAASARHAVRLTCRTLQYFWLPALDDAERSTHV